jgi:hypothetical protein
MADRQKYRGLCETCEHDPTCMLRRSTQLEIIQCEEFSIQPAIPNSVPLPDFLAADPVEAARMGLCANCRSVDTCGFPNARRGVVQCEEYLLDEEASLPPAQTTLSESAA